MVLEWADTLAILSMLGVSDLVIAFGMLGAMLLGWRLIVHVLAH